MQAKIPLGIALSFLITSPLANEIAIAVVLAIPLYIDAVTVLPVRIEKFKMKRQNAKVKRR